MSDQLVPTLEVLTEAEQAEALRWSRAEYLTVEPDPAFPGLQYAVMGHRQRHGAHGEIEVGTIHDARKPRRKTLRTWVYTAATPRDKRTSSYLWDWEVQ